MLANDRALMACELLDRLAVRDETVLRRVFDACLVTVVDMSRDGNEFARRLHMAAHALWRITRQFPLESLWMALMDTNDPTRAKRLGHVICSCNELAVRTEVRERLHSLEAQNDSRQMLAQELLNHMNAQDLIELVRRKP